MGKGSVRVAAILNEASMYSVMATPVDPETLMLFAGFTAACIPDHMDPNAEGVILLYRKEIDENFYTKGKFRFVSTGIISEIS